MPDLREVFEVTTKQMGKPDLDAWREQQERQRKANRNKKIGAFAVAAGIVMVAAAVIIGTRGSQETTTPADQSTLTGKTAVQVATEFFVAASLSNEDQAIGLLADGADLSGYGVNATGEFRLLMRFWEATGFKQTLDSYCEKMSSSPSGTVVRCRYHFDGIRSGQLGQGGPYGGSYEDITVRDGKIVDVDGHIETGEFSSRMWNPFAEWVSTNYPRDVEVMYVGDFSDYQLTPESIRLWEQHSREYVRAVRQGTA